MRGWLFLGTIALMCMVLLGCQSSNDEMELLAPDYDLLVKYKDGSTQGFHLLLGKNGERSALMYIGHEGKAFYVSEEATEKLSKFVNSAQ